MSSRHFYSSADGLVLKSLRGAVLLNPSLRLHAASRTVYTADRTDDVQVAVISGGGAGHEPAHAGYTGRGMLSACVSGEIFASPSSKQILHTIRVAACPSEAPSKKCDVLVIINNYTGDRLNFGLAIEKAKVLYPDVNIASVVVSDDVSLLDSPTTQAVGPRGLAGNILVCKLLGALAQTGADLETVKSYGDVVVSDLSSIGLTLEHCHVPGRAPNSELMPDGECEVGLGLHNEAGVSRRKMDGVQGVIQEMIEMIVNSKTESSAVIGREDDLVLFVNNLGGVSQLEMGAILSDVVDELDKRDLRPRRTYLSSFMTSLNAPGFSISILNTSAVDRKLISSGLSINTYNLLDAPTEAHSWLGVRQRWDRITRPQGTLDDTYDATDYPSRNTGLDQTSKTASDVRLPATIEPALRSACEAVLGIEKELTEYDTVAGDGDCGYTFTAGARVLLSEIETRGHILFDMDPATLTERIADILEDKMGGTIGALFGIYLNAYSHALRSENELHKAPLQALEDLCRHTTAKPGDRTVIDALRPFCEVLADTGDLEQAVSAAMSGAMRTREMKPRLGRAAYVGKMMDESYAVVDPGAWGVAKLLEGLSEGFFPSGRR